MKMGQFPGAVHMLWTLCAHIFHFQVQIPSICECRCEALVALNATPSAVFLPPALQEEVWEGLRLAHV